MATQFDAVVIGSGFGGAVLACRLAEAGYKVLVLERGRRWKESEFPRDIGDPWIWDNDKPQEHNGWFDIRFFPHMNVILGSAVGGGSLHYANVSVEARPDLFEMGWPPEITFQELKPYYDMVGKMLNVQTLPPNQWAARTKLMKEAAEKSGYGAQFRPLELAVTFDKDWNYDLDDPHDAERWGKPFVNAQGVKQSTCVHLGECDIGCPVLAKNTLDLNYIPQAEKHGAEVRPLHIVRAVKPIPGGDGYEVFFEQIASGELVPGIVSARIVILAAGSLGSTELLLHCRDTHKSLPDVSRKLGHDWSSNGNYLSAAIHPNRQVYSSWGVPIASGIDFLSEYHRPDGSHFLIEDGGFPDITRGAWERRLDIITKELSKLKLGKTPFMVTVRNALKRLLRLRRPLPTTMLWFANSRDAGDGQLSLRRFLGIFGKPRLFLKWSIAKSLALINAIIAMHAELAKATDGKLEPQFLWLLFRDLTTPHPLGGCKMGISIEDGVVDHKGEVFGYRNLFVADGAIIPKAIGNNPSRTIAALAERIAKIIVDEKR